MTGSAHRHTHVLVLAGGEGTRLASFTRDENGRVVPKQFALQFAGETLFQATLRRAGRLVGGEQITAVLAGHHRRWWIPQLGRGGDAHVVVQPSDRGSAAATLLGLQHVLARDAGARVLLLPSDHAIRDEDAWASTLVDMIDVMHEDNDRVVVLGMPSDDLGLGYGWIVPGESRSALAEAVVGLHHDVAPLVAEGLDLRGALVDSMVVAGSAAGLVALHAHAVPEIVSAFQAALGTRRDPPPAVVQSLYCDLPKRDLSRDVLGRATEALSVVRGRRCGWTDLDTPERLASHGRMLETPRASAHRSLFG
jgi:mannose-1-phosphate guanylyltransferase